MVFVKSHIEKRISEILSAEKRGGMPRLMLDVLRALVVYRGTSWKSELVRELSFFHAFKGEPEVVGGEELNEALGSLEKEGLVKVERRVRADMSARSDVEDQLITLVDFLATRNALARDRVLTSYTREQIMASR